MENNETSNENNVKKNSGFIYIIIVLLVIVVVAIGVIFIYKKQNNDNNVNSQIDNTSNNENNNVNNNENNNSVDDGNTNKYDIEIETSANDMFLYTAPNDFKSKEITEGVVDYYHPNLGCEFQLFSLKTNKTIEEYVANNNYKYVKDIDVNGINWKVYANQSENAGYNTYISKQNEHLILYMFIGKNECETYENQVLNSIKLK